MTIKEIIAARNENSKNNNKLYNDTIAKWTSLDSQVQYNPAFIKENLRKELEIINNKEGADNLQFNKQLKNEVEKLCNKIKCSIYPDFEKPVDYTTQIANALNVINSLGSNITDKSANIILEPFKNDYDQMKIFNIILENIANKTVEANKNLTPIKFTETFSHFNECAEVMEKCDEIMKIAESLFLHTKIENNYTRFDDSYMVNSYTDSYSEIAGQQRIITLITEVSAYAD